MLPVIAGVGLHRAGESEGAAAVWAVSYAVVNTH